MDKVIGKSVSKHNLLHIIHLKQYATRNNAGDMRPCTWMAQYATKNKHYSIV